MWLQDFDNLIELLHEIKQNFKAIISQKPGWTMKMLMKIPCIKFFIRLYTRQEKVLKKTEVSPFTYASHGGIGWDPTMTK